MEACQHRYRLAQYTLIDGVLYKIGFSFSYLRCLGPDKVGYVLREISKMIYGNHFGRRALAYKPLRQIYFWLTMFEHSKQFSKKCDKCQHHAMIPSLLTQQLISVINAWPFAQWGIDIIGPLPIGKRQCKYCYRDNRRFHEVG